MIKSTWRSPSLILLMVGLLAGGCGKDSPSAPEGPDTVSHQLTISNNCVTVIQIFIDNQDRGFVQPLQSRVFSLTEGGHTVTFQDQTGQYTISVTLNQNLALPTCG